LKLYPARFFPEDRRGSFYLTTDSSGHSIVSSVSEKNRVNIGASSNSLDVWRVPRTLLWSIQFSRDGTPLPPEPPPPPEDCKNDSFCQTSLPDVPPRDNDCPATRACLNGGTFWVSVDYYEGHWKAATELKGIDLPDTAALFWFYDPQNPELLVKVLNGCAINGHWWVYGSAATDRNYEVTVRRPNQTGLRFRRISPAVPIAYTTGIPCLSGE